MVLGLTAINWIILIPATLVWPLVAVVVIVYVVANRSAKRHEESADAAQRQALLDAAAAGQHWRRQLRALGPATAA